MESDELGDAGGATDWANWQRDPGGNQRESLLEGSLFNQELGWRCCPGARRELASGFHQNTNYRARMFAAPPPQSTLFKDHARPWLPFLGHVRRCVPNTALCKSPPLDFKFNARMIPEERSCVCLNHYHIPSASQCLAPGCPMEQHGG